MQSKAWRSVKLNKLALLSFMVFVAVIIFILNGAKERTGEQLAKAGARRQADPALQQVKHSGEFLSNGSGRLSNPFMAGHSLEQSAENAKNGESHLENAVHDGKIGFVLTGVMECGGERIAIIENGRKSGLYREKERLGAYRVESITLERVILQRGKETLALKVARW